MWVLRIGLRTSGLVKSTSRILKFRVLDLVLWEMSLYTVKIFYSYWFNKIN